ncbi:hypothetical protein [Candidatus Nanosynbacter sp. HMT-352]|jgi:hypothetical protein|uniref:hypothetical protein n=1 Tax=Candidatus Nanosynbacter sp. HMT-352 TaxID=2899133 RepID=UPI001E3E905F|nr:hypothetical protein [Candidatus Nanosynbacter sp. HMT-352]UHA57504.1 hypothetical protein LR957_00690 [Candidatus Nanosynbacter sp. HMT-352]
MFEEYDGIPNRLRQVTAETMSPEVLYTLDTYPDVSPQDVMYIDESRAEGNGRLIISKGQSVKLLEEANLSTPNLVVLMSVWQRNDQGDLYRGIIADCRFYSGRFDVEYGDGINDEFYNNDDEQVISAVIDYGYNGEVKIWGDPTFFDAARYMAGLVDNESIEEDGVIAGSREIQSGVNDDNSFIPFYKRALNGLGRVVRAKRRK